MNDKLLVFSSFLDQSHSGAAAQITEHMESYQ